MQVDLRETLEKQAKQARTVLASELVISCQHV
jgi:hypothetical protein